jgi:hypothetical protein
MKSIRYLTIAALVAATFAACDRIGTGGLTHAGDVSFARDTFESLARGDSAVESKIDWKTLQSLGSNIGSDYVSMKTEADQKGFRDAFITQFSASFREGGGKIENFSNWRSTESDALKTIIAADSPNGLLKITVTDRDGKKRLSGFEMVK